MEVVVDVMSTGPVVVLKTLERSEFTLETVCHVKLIFAPPPPPPPLQMILFTTDEEILSRVGDHDDYFQTYRDFTHEAKSEVCLPNMEVGTEDEGGGEEEREGVREGGQADHTELY